TMPQQMKAVVMARVLSNPKLSEADKKAALERADKAIPGVMATVHNVLTDPTLVDEMITEMVPLYARTYTADEIRQLSAFYQTPLGQKMLRTMPQLSAESMKIANRIMAPRVQKMTQQMTENFAKPQTQ
ncbi:MAG TPA: DUF2059 domain-containing protein, partial [Telluria sp.]|nr:DUF2059 domain-containing protein [Telluria sp.]